MLNEQTNILAKAKKLFERCRKIGNQTNLYERNVLINVWILNFKSNLKSVNDICERHRCFMIKITKTII